MRILLTGFGPFGDHQENPSAEAARGAAEVVPTEWEADVETLPVEYDAALEWVDEAVGRADDSLVALHFGLGAGREAVCLERFARKCIEERPDEAGAIPDTGRLAEDGPRRRETSLDLERLATAVRSELADDVTTAVRTSDDAGEFVCNALYYRSLTGISENAAAEAASLFVHIPNAASETAHHIGEAVGRATIARWRSQKTEP